MPYTIRTAAVLGAGTMGAQIAAHLANAGIPTRLLDLTPELAREGLNRAAALKPDPFFAPEVRRLVTTAGFDEGLADAGACDWVVEAVVEDLAVKQALFERLERVRRPGTIVSSNTSGLPIAALGAGRTDEFRRHLVGTHFFNPPRYLHLLEVIPTPDTDPAVVDAVVRFADHALGKGVVIAKDTPNFIANHLGLYGVLRVFDQWATGRYTIEEIDAMTGPVLGRPASATFRTLDLAGLDVVAHVVRNLAARLPSEEARRAFALPAVVAELVRRGWTGEKAGQGFYKKVTEQGRSVVLVLDPATFEYRPQRPVELPALEAARAIEDPAARIRTLFLGRDPVGEFLRATLGSLLVYAARVALDIAHSIDDVDRAMRWGFGWELGPFETWDAIGIREVLEACAVADPPPLVRAVLERSGNRFRNGRARGPAAGVVLVPPAAPDLQILRTARDQSRVVRRTPGASLVDLGDGVLAVEFHSKMNALGGDAVEMLRAGVQEAVAHFEALVVGNEAPHFSAGANLMLLLLEAREGNWDEIDLMIRAFQAATSALRYAPVPVVAATAGLTLGGGCEIALHADRVQAAAETYMGLVEVGVGLIPAGGGTKEMLVRALAHAPAGANPLPFVQRAFETIAFATVSTSALDARRLGYLREVDGLTMNRERLLADAKAVALRRVREGYRPPLPPTDIPVGGADVLAALTLGVHLAHRAGRITDHERLVGRKLAWVLAGGSLPHAAEVSEQYLLDLEREAFLSLCGEPKTQERIAYTLRTGKTLRN